jgi:hypothetical protein
MNWSGNCHTEDAPIFEPGLGAATAEVKQATTQKMAENQETTHFILLEGIVLKDAYCFAASA